MRRGAILAWVVALAALLAGVGCASSLALAQEALPSEPAADAPNVVFVLTDDMRYEEFEKLARFREFAREGTFFERAYVTNSMCCPSRSTALTGRYSHNHGVLSNKTRGDVRGGFGAHKNLGTGAHNLGNGLADALGAAGRKAHPLILRPETVPTAEVATTFELDGQISGQVRDALADGQFP